MKYLHIPVQFGWVAVGPGEEQPGHYSVHPHQRPGQARLPPAARSLLPRARVLPPRPARPQLRG